jgi:ubiquinone/menaquinone biosynthesis C-methylase UbiE
MQGSETMTDPAQATHNRQIIDQFTKQAIPFANKPEHSSEKAMRLTLEMTGVTGGDTVLDVACGPGLVACAFAQVARYVTGIDLVPAMIESAKQLQKEQHIANVSWQVGDVLPLPFADGTFSLVMSRYAFHHFIDSKAVLAEMYRVCVPGGRVAVIDLAIDPDKSTAFDNMEKLRDPSHVHALSLAELHHAMQAVGLTNLRTECYGVEMEVEKQLAASAPHPGDANKFRQVFLDDLETNRLGVDAHHKNGAIYYTYPIAIVVGQKPV